MAFDSLQLNAGAVTPNTIIASIQILYNSLEYSPSFIHSTLYNVSYRQSLRNGKQNKDKEVQVAVKILVEKPDGMHIAELRVCR